LRDAVSVPPSEAIQHYYDQLAVEEWQRLDAHRTELALTLRALAEHLPPPAARVLDCGGGPGRYAIELARQGHRVTLFDLSPQCLELARAKAAEAGVTLAALDQGNATDLSRYGAASFDAVLLMGPLYHLLHEDERGRALREARRVLRPGGWLFAAFNTRYAAIRYSAVHDVMWVPQEPERVKMLLDTGVLPGRRSGPLEFAAYYAHPGEVRPLLEGQGFAVISLLGVEGLISMIEEQVNELSDDAWQAWVDLNYGVAADPAILGCVGHLLAVARKPERSAGGAA